MTRLTTMRNNLLIQVIVSNTSSRTLGINKLYKKQKSIFIITHFRYMHILQNQQIWWHPQFSHLKSMGLLLVTWYVLSHQVTMKKCQIFWMRSLVTWRSIISKKNAKQKWIKICFKIQLRYIYSVIADISESYKMFDSCISYGVSK